MDWVLEGELQKGYISHMKAQASTYILDLEDNVIMFSIETLSITSCYTSQCRNNIGDSDSEEAVEHRAKIMGGL